MSIINMSGLLRKAEDGFYGIGAFNVANMEMIMGAVQAAEELKSPIILQVAQVRLPYSPLHMLGPMMVEAAKASTVPIAVQLDHGTDLETIQHALDIGFSSVMIDASHLPIEENIKMVQKVKEMTRAYEATVEAEVGQLAGSEGDAADQAMLHSDPLHVEMLYQKAGPDAIALSIGNAHGLYKKEPRLQFNLLLEAKKRVPIPLVLHGGSGISDEDFRKCIAGGMRKINIATATFRSVEHSVRGYCQTEENDYFKMSKAMVEGAYENVYRHIKLFQSDNKA